jgi:hypothetical protein
MSSNELQSLGIDIVVDVSVLRASYFIKLCQLSTAHDICSQHLTIQHPLVVTYQPIGRPTNFIPSVPPGLDTCISSPFPSSSYLVLQNIIIEHHHRISSPDDGKRAHAFHSIYIVLHSANIVIQYIGWGFHIGFGLGIVYIRYVSISSSAGLQITRHIHIVHAFLERTIAPLFNCPFTSSVS